MPRYLRVLFCLLVASPFVEGTPPPPLPPSASRARLAFAELQQRYWDPSAGWWDASMWWQTANTVEAVCNLGLRAPDLKGGIVPLLETVFAAT